MEIFEYCHHDICSCHACRLIPFKLPSRPIKVNNDVVVDHNWTKDVHSGPKGVIHGLMFQTVDGLPSIIK